MTASQVAEAFDVSLMAVGKWRKAGCPCNPDKTYDIREVIKWRDAKREEKPDHDWDEEDKKWGALLKRHKFETHRGRYYEAATAAAWWNDRVTEARTAMQSLGTALAPALVGMDAPAIRNLIDDRCRSICESLNRKALDAMNDGDDDAPAKDY